MITAPDALSSQHQGGFYSPSFFAGPIDALWAVPLFYLPQRRRSGLRSVPLEACPAPRELWAALREGEAQMAVYGGCDASHSGSFTSRGPVRWGGNMFALVEALTGLGPSLPQPMSNAVQRCVHTGDDAAFCS